MQRTDDLLPALPGQRLQRGVCRALVQSGFATVEELVPSPGLRVDVMALGPRGEVWIVECKSSRADFRADRKWQGYLDWCDRFFWAVEPDFPTDLLPEGHGLLLADAMGQRLSGCPPRPRLPRPGARPLCRPLPGMRRCAFRRCAIRACRSAAGFSLGLARWGRRAAIAHGPGGFSGGALLDSLDLLPNGPPRVIVAGLLGLLGAAAAARAVGGGA